MLSAQNTERLLIDQLLGQLRATLCALPEVQEVQAKHEVRAVGGRPVQYDALVNLRVAGKPLAWISTAH